MKRVVVLISVLAAVLALQVSPALAQDSGSLAQYSEGSSSAPPATVTFELTVEGEVPEGKLLGVEMGVADAPQPVFCSTGNFHTDLPRCEDGGTYTDTTDLFFVGDTLSYEYYVMDYEYGGIVETFSGDTVTVSDGQVISATYKAGESPEGEQVTLTGTIEKPEMTAYQYGTHAVTDGSTGTLYALGSETVNLDDYVGKQVTVYGTLVPGYEDGQIEGGPPLVEVTRVEPIEEPGDYEVTLSFELATEGPPPMETSFFGFIPAEGGIATELTDPDGDGVYTGSMDIPQYPPGPRPVPEGVEPVTLPVQIVMSSEVKYGVPLYPNLIKDFGNVLMDEDKTFSASTVFEGPGKPVEPGNENPGNESPGNEKPDDENPGDENPGDEPGNDVPEGVDVLPDTGGFALAALGTAVLLVAASLLFTGLRSTGVLRRR